jgi:hypothetical protein
MDSKSEHKYNQHMGSTRPVMTPLRIDQINAMIRDNPGWHRSRLSKELCELWNWRGESGQLKDISCRDVLRALDASGKIVLPKQIRNAGGNADRVVLLPHDTTIIKGRLGDITPLAVEVVEGKHSLMEFKSYIEQFHYLGYGRSIGENIKYFVNDRHGRRLACLMFGSAAWSCWSRDAYIGWDREQRKSTLKYLTNNVRFLIFDWVDVRFLSSHMLSIICRRISSDWVAKYGHPLFLLETFVELGRFRGTSYKAANWKRVGTTAGMGRNCKTAVGELPVKDIYLYPLHKRFREKLCGHGGY